MRSLIIVVVVAAAFVAACSTRTGPAVVDEDPVVPIATTGKPDKEGAAIWRKACETIHAAELAVLQKKIDAGDKKAQTAADDVMLSCLEGFMAMPDAASNMAAACIMKAENQEAVFRCLQEAIHHEPTPEPDE